MSVNVKLGSGGDSEVTPAGSGTFDITITNGSRVKAYTEAFDSDVETTIDNFLVSHATDIAERFTILAEDGTTTLDLFGLNGAIISSATAAVGATTVTTEVEFDAGSITTTKVASAKSMTLNLGNASVDVVTVTVLNAVDLAKFKQDLALFRQVASLGGTVSPSVACKGAIA
jgi:hypothetical protein